MAKTNYIYQGSTATVRYTFTGIDPTTISEAYLTCIQGDTLIDKGDVVFEKTMTSMTAADDHADWKLAQADNFALKDGIPCDFQMTYKLGGSDAYKSAHIIADVVPSNKQGVI